MSVRTDWSRFWLPLVGSWLWLIGTTNFAEAQFVFRDVGDEAGLFPHVSKIAGHSAAWGDIDGDGWPDLYVSTFGGHPYDSKPNQLFRNVRGKFTLDEQPALRVLGRASGSVSERSTNATSKSSSLTVAASGNAVTCLPISESPSPAIGPRLRPTAVC